jgi:nucleoside-diphosphate-sugar epimerase
MTWLVTGAAGYIGAHVVVHLLTSGERVVGLDDLSTGDAGRLPAEVPLIRADVTDAGVVRAALACHEVTGVMHLAGVKLAPESTRRPIHYYRQNVGAVAAVLEAMTGSQSSPPSNSSPPRPVLTTCPGSPCGTSTRRGRQPPPRRPGHRQPHSPGVAGRPHRRAPRGGR